MSEMTQKKSEVMQIDVQKENDQIQEAFEIKADEMGFCLDQKWGDYENPYENSDTSLAFNLFKSGWKAKASEVPEGFVLVPRIITDEWMGAYIDSRVNDYCNDYKDSPFYVRENELPEIKENHRKPIRDAHKRLMQVIEAQELSNDC